MLRDPVCGMEVDERPALKTNYKGKDYYFCSPTCLEQFRKNPEKFV